MFRILIVDDEPFTRESIIECIPWLELGISMVKQAANSVNALSISADFQPDILLTDVKMPRMDGIELSFKIREIYPQCKIIFMSGYSDKEYLKSAIVLKAITYVEKPINLTELKSAIEEAVKLCHQQNMQNKNNLVLSKMLIRNIPLVKNEIALQLNSSINDPELLKNRLLEIGLDLSAKADFVSLLIRLPFINSLNVDQHDIFIRNLYQELDTIIERCGTYGFFVMRNSEYIVLHITSDIDQNYTLRRGKIIQLVNQISDYLSDHKILISIGKTVKGIYNAPESYKTAVLAMQKTFYYNYGYIIFYATDSSQSYMINDCIFEDFSNSLSNEIKGKAIFLLKTTAMEFRRHDNSLVDYTKDIFYRLMLILHKLSTEVGIKIFEAEESENFLWKSFSYFYTLTDVEEYCISKIVTYFNIVTNRNKNSSTVSTILKYIHNNYHNDKLTVNQISEHCYLSTSYMCSIFKQETKKTISQFLTEYRIERAKELLKDKRFKVADIATKVGYNDGQYFAKAFKKEAGISPSEYREKYRI